MNSSSTTKLSYYIRRQLFVGQRGISNRCNKCKNKRHYNTITNNSNNNNHNHKFNNDYKFIHPISFGFCIAGLGLTAYKINNNNDNDKYNGVGKLLSSSSSSSSSSLSSSFPIILPNGLQNLGTFIINPFQINNNNNCTQCATSRNIEDFYTIIEKPIGHGGFGVVVTGIHRETGEVVAIKQMSRKSTSRHRVTEEIDILMIAGEHRNIINFKDLFYNDESWYIVMEMASGGELFERLVQKGAYSEEQASSIMGELLEAVTYLHQQGIVHFDIKPENVLLSSDEHGEDDKHLRLVDFGSACRLTRDKGVPRSGSGTIAYSAPEVLRGELCNYQSDIWSLGVLLYILLSGYHPFDPYNSASDEVMKKRILQGNYLRFDAPVWKSVSPRVIELITQMLNNDPLKRPSSNTLIHDPWISGEEKLSKLPLSESAENLRRFHRGRRRLKALMLAVMSGLANEKDTLNSLSEQAANTAIKHRHVDYRKYSKRGIEMMGSRRAAISFFDRENKGYLSADDITRVAHILGEELSEKEIAEMLKAADGNPRTTQENIRHEELVKLLPALCPSRKFQYGQNIFTEGEIDSTFYLMKRGKAILNTTMYDSTDKKSKDNFSDSVKKLIKGKAVPKPFSKMKLLLDEDNDKIEFTSLDVGSSFGEIELMVTNDGTTLPRVASCICVSPLCEVIAMEQFLFSHLTDVFDSVGAMLFIQGEKRVSKLFNRWATNEKTKGEYITKKAGDILWSNTDGGDTISKPAENKFYFIKRGFVEVKLREEEGTSSETESNIIAQSLGPGGYWFTGKVVEKHINKEKFNCEELIALTDAEVIEIPEKTFKTFLKSKNKDVLKQFFNEY